MSCVQENNFKYKYIDRLNVKDWEKNTSCNISQSWHDWITRKNYISE